MRSMKVKGTFAIGRGFVAGLMLGLLSSLGEVTGVYTSHTTQSYVNVTVTPGDSISSVEGETRNMAATVCWDDSASSITPQYFSVMATSSDTATVMITSAKTAFPSNNSNLVGYANACAVNSTIGLAYHVNFTVRAIRLGVTMIYIRFVPEWEDRPDSNLSDIDVVYRLKTTVLRPFTIADTLFNVILIILLALNNIVFGCSFDFDSAKESFRRPLAPSIGFVSQAIVLPLLAFGIGYGLQLPPATAFGLLTTGASPGGGQSNIYTTLLDGDLTLSVCMTVISSLLSFATMPLWLLTLGKTILDDVTLPYGSILLSMLPLILPLIIGLLIRHFAPKVATKISKVMRPLALIFVLFVCSFGVYVYRYAFVFIFSGWRIWVAGLLLPWSGIIISGLVAFAFRLSWEKIKTIMIETSLQNSAIALLVLRQSLPQPEADLTSVVPIACLLFAPLPFIIAFIVKLIARAHTRIWGTTGKNKVDNVVIDDIPAKENAEKCRAVEDNGQSVTRESNL